MLFDADAVLREVTGLQGAALPELRRVFGKSVFSDADTLNREALADLVFSDSKAKKRLESILHPLLWQEFDRVVAGLLPEAILVAEIPLITETGNAGRFDVVVMVDAPHETRLRRLTEQRHLSVADANARIAAQATRAQRESIAHVWVENTGSPAALEADAEALWQIWLET